MHIIKLDPTKIIISALVDYIKTGVLKIRKMISSSILLLINS